jgi:hypothetical protein
MLIMTELTVTSYSYLNILILKKVCLYVWGGKTRIQGFGGKT